jgi:DNA repair exonuclease
MRFLLTSDWHIRSNRPKSRIDNYKETLFGKIKWVLDQDLIVLQAGDFFDSPFAPYSLTLETLKLLQKTPCCIYTIYGQHDLRYHTSKENTPLAILNEVGEIAIVNNTKFLSDLDIYGCSYNEQIPTIINKNKFNILLIHKMMIQDKLWDAQTGHTNARPFLMNNKFDLIVSGDNHQFFIEEYNGRFLVNPGSLMRSTTAQKEHKPRVIIFDTEDKTCLVKNIPIKPIEEVMKFDEKEEERNEQLETFVKGLSEEKELGLNFMENFFDYCVTNKLDKQIIDLVKECGNNE